MTDEEMEVEFNKQYEEFVRAHDPESALEERRLETRYYDHWGCGYGQKSDGLGGCIDTEAYKEERYGREDDPSTPDVDESATGYQFRDDEEGACGIGKLFNPDTGLCEMRDDTGLIEDKYGLICPANEMTVCEWDQSMKVCDSNDCPDPPANRNLYNKRTI